MTTLFFGERWDAPIVDDPAQQVETPIGEVCYVCNEPILDGEQGLLRGVIGTADDPTVAYVHRECEMLGIIGHMVGVCHCSPMDGTRRDWAREVLRRVEAGALRRL